LDQSSNASGVTLFARQTRKIPSNSLTSLLKPRFGTLLIVRRPGWLSFKDCCGSFHRNDRPDHCGDDDFMAAFHKVRSAFWIWFAVMLAQLAGLLTVIRTR
jgi:hypothetical protein